MEQDKDKKLAAEAKRLADAEAAVERLRTMPIVAIGPLSLAGDKLSFGYDEADKLKYQGGDPSCRYWKVRFNPIPIPDTKRRPEDAKPGPRYFRRALGGKASAHGEFPAIFVREQLSSRGYKVLLSEPRLPNDGGYVLLAYPGYKERNDRSFQQMTRIFGEDRIKQLIGEVNKYKKKMKHESFRQMKRILKRTFGADKVKELIREVDKLKKRITPGGGGDPDLFVFKGDGKTERFFVEVKDKGDTLSPLQIVCFWLIKYHLDCDVKICEISPLEASD